MVSGAVIGFKADGFREVSNGFIVQLKVEVSVAAIIESSGVTGFEADGFGVVINGGSIIALLRGGMAAIKSRLG